ncbi:putative membrane protein [Pediococcus claussenii ATCC BAA-344]|uniref:Membrane protein n=1 Tax=Pediococcus claussenii (strain ATCC BAA-344 / DSM 14800 / JCM 18046 / KCTC 3811 / LMG 21948 / P06) TaxID=701521 RepID=G8PCC5_PEDCP|nr:putative membrane protein [Pediococcus claussenii ATCC BAA-344]
MTSVVTLFLFGNIGSSLTVVGESKYFTLTVMLAFYFFICF